MKRHYDFVEQEVPTGKRQKLEDDSECRITVETSYTTSLPSSCVLVINEVASGEVLGEKDCFVLHPGTRISTSFPAVTTSSSKTPSPPNATTTTASPSPPTTTTASPSTPSPTASPSTPSPAPPSGPEDDIPRVSWQHLSKGKYLGEGLYGIAYMGILTSPDLTIMDVVLKFSKTGHSFLREAVTLKELNGAGGTPQLVGLTSEAPEALVMEFCRGIVLSSYLQNIRPGYASSQRKCEEVLLKVGEKLGHFHATGYVHGDLHSGNILVDVSQDTVRIIDVGSSRRVTNISEREPLMERDRQSIWAIYYRWLETQYSCSAGSNNHMPRNIF